MSADVSSRQAQERARQAMVAFTEHDEMPARLAAAGKAVAYVVVAGVAVGVATGSGGSGSDSGEQAASTLFDLPGGVVLVGGVGLGFAAVGFFLVWKGLSSSFSDDLERGALQGGTGTASYGWAASASQRKGWRWRSSVRCSSARL